MNEILEKNIKGRIKSFHDVTKKRSEFFKKIKILKKEKEEEIKKLTGMLEKASEAINNNNYNINIQISITLSKEIKELNKKIEKRYVEYIVLLYINKYKNKDTKVEDILINLISKSLSNMNIVLNAIVDDFCSINFSEDSCGEAFHYILRLLSLFSLQNNLKKTYPF